MYGGAQDIKSACARRRELLGACCLNLVHVVHRRDGLHSPATFVAPRTRNCRSPRTRAPPSPCTGGTGSATPHGAAAAAWLPRVRSPDRGARWWRWSVRAADVGPV